MILLSLIYLWSYILSPNNFINSSNLINGSSSVVKLCNQKKINSSLYFKTTYIIKIDKILNKHSEIDINDTVELKHITGYVGNCDPKNKDLFSMMPGIKEYKIGERNIFLLSHNNYYSHFIKNKYDQNSKYEDEYCPNAFLLSLENEYFDISRFDVLEKFMKYNKIVK